MRVDGKGLIDRTRPLKIRFDGQNYVGFHGDTVASLLLANDVHLVGRSFKYHRPRGILTAGSEEPNALMHVGARPNVRATMQEVWDGLEVRSQNHWPSLQHDALAVNDLLAPWFGAGFYYKTFMWPRKFWMKLYEPAIRRAAGLGRLSGEADATVNEKAYAHCDVLVIGAGPAGLVAALTAGRAGADVILADEKTRVGGRLLAEDELIDDAPAVDWVDRCLTELRAMPNVRIMTRTTVTGAYDGGIYGAVERVGLHGDFGPDIVQETFWRIYTKGAVLCSGAIERPIAFRNNDRPGIMMASGVRSYLHRYGVATGQRVAIFANNDDGHRTARDLLACGVEVVGLIDTRGIADPGLGIPFFGGSVVEDTGGRGGVNTVHVRTNEGRRVKMAVDCLAVSGGWNPSLHIACHLNKKPVWNPQIHAFIPAPDMVPGLEVAGAALGVFSTKGAMKSGQFRARAVLTILGLDAGAVDLPRCEEHSTAIEPKWAVEGKGRAWLDFQNDVTVKDVKLAAQENFRSVEHMKRYTTQGMATDQGKNSNVNALAVLADATGREIAATGTTTFRPPYTPVSIASLGAGGQQKGFAPERFMTSHEASVERHAPMIEAGLWYRPSYFPKPGETNWRQSCDREVNMVRNAVGVCDVSTLGKIDIQGEDAALFLDLVYTNTFSTLKPGRVRYGLMLREDGFVMDDGTTACLGPNHYLMTTTTAAAGPVMAHLELVAQAYCPDWDVQIVSVTEQWAQFAVAGPRARDVLATVLADEKNAFDLAFMGCCPVNVMGVAGRLFRISFSGEQGFELAVPARFGDSLFRLLVTHAEALGGGPYGMEALNVLRIEKGFITHAEIHGRVTAADIGMGRMVSAKKDCIGKFMANRPGLTEAGREQLVGLRPAGSVKLLTAGAHLFEVGADAVRENDQGYITSAGYSPTLETVLALGFLKDGQSRHGETVRMVDHLRGVEAMCLVTDPVAFDPKGERLRG